MTHFPQLEADFARYYQLDLPAAVWGDPPMSARRLATLTAELPPDSATARAAGGVPAGWGTAEELLATLVEVTHAGNAMFHRVHSEKGARPMEPVRIPRPYDAGNGAARPQPRKATSAEMVAFFKGAGAAVKGPRR